MKQNEDEVQEEIQSQQWQQLKECSSNNNDNQFCQNNINNYNMIQLSSQNNFHQRYQRCSDSINWENNNTSFQQNNNTSFQQNNNTSFEQSLSNTISNYSSINFQQSLQDYSDSYSSSQRQNLIRMIPGLQRYHQNQQTRFIQTQSDSTLTGWYPSISQSNETFISNQNCQETKLKIRSLRYQQSQISQLIQPSLRLLSLKNQPSSNSVSQSSQQCLSHQPTLLFFSENELSSSRLQSTESNETTSANLNKQQNENCCTVFSFKKNNKIKNCYDDLKKNNTIQHSYYDNHSSSLNNSYLNIRYQQKCKSSQLKRTLIIQHQKSEQSQAIQCNNFNKQCDEESNNKDQQQLKSLLKNININRSYEN